MIRQLCYLSTATSDWAEGDLARLLQGASLYNEAARVSGLLAYGGGVFFQVLEGPRDNVGAAFARICRDPRHHDLRLLQDETVASRDFGSFPLALRSFDPSAVPGIGGFIAASAIPAIVAGLGHDLTAALPRRAAAIGIQAA